MHLRDVKEPLKCDVIDFRLLHIVSKRGLRSDLGVVFWRFIFCAFQSRKKAVKCGVFVFLFICIFSMVGVLSERALSAPHIKI